MMRHYFRGFEQITCHPAHGLSVYTLLFYRHGCFRSVFGTAYDIILSLFRKRSSSGHGPMKEIRLIALICTLLLDDSWSSITSAETLQSTFYLAGTGC